MIPNDPAILLSFVNAKLRDEYESFDELCAALDAPREDILSRLRAIGYEYAEDHNQFL